MTVKVYSIYLFFSVTTLIASILISVARGTMGVDIQNLALFATFAAAFFYLIIFIHWKFNNIKKKQFWLSIVMLLYMSIPLLSSSSSSIDPSRSQFYSTIHFFFMMGVFVFPLLLLTNFKKKHQQVWKKLIVVSNRLIAFYLFINSIWFYGVEGSGLAVRLSGFQSQANSFGAIVFVAFLGSHLELVICGNKFSKVLLFFALVLALLTQSRTVLQSIVVYYVIFLSLTSGAKRQYIIGVVLLSILLAGFVARQSHTNNYRRDVDPVEELTDYGGSMRLFIWFNALEYWAREHRIVLGTGYETGYEVNKNTATGLLFMKRQGLNDSVGISLHSGIINILVTQGVVGMLLFLIIQLLLIKIIWQSEAKIRAVGVAVILSGVFMDVSNVSIWAALGSFSSIAYFIVLITSIMAANINTIDYNVAK